MAILSKRKKLQNKKKTRKMRGGSNSTSNTTNIHWITKKKENVNTAQKILPIMTVFGRLQKRNQTVGPRVENVRKHLQANSRTDVVPRKTFGFMPLESKKSFLRRTEKSLGITPTPPKLKFSKIAGKLPHI